MLISRVVMNITIIVIIDIYRLSAIINQKTVLQIVINNTVIQIYIYNNNVFIQNGYWSTTRGLAGTATVMSTQAAGVMNKELGKNNQEADSNKCDQPKGLRSYGAGGISVKICKKCGYFELNFHYCFNSQFQHVKIEKTYYFHNFQSVLELTFQNQANCQ